MKFVFPLTRYAKCSYIWIDRVSRVGEGLDLGKRAVAAPKQNTMRLRLGAEDLALLDVGVATFKLTKSALIRRAVRAVLEAGPALSEDGVVAVMRLTKQIQAVGRNLAQVVRAINAGHAVQIADCLPIIDALRLSLAAIEQEALDLTSDYGAKVRRLANLKLEAE